MTQKMLKKIGFFCLKTKNLLCCYILFFVLVFTTFVYCARQNSKMNLYYTKVKKLEHLSLHSIKKRKFLKDFLKEKIAADPLFIENNLEKLPLLEKEKKFLQTLIKLSSFANSKELKNRLNFLNEEENRLKFAQENINKTKLVKETTEAQLYPVEIDTDDLEKILAIIESHTIEKKLPVAPSPQLIIKNFFLKKDKESCFSLEMSILKREFFKKETL